MSGYPKKRSRREIKIRFSVNCHTVWGHQVFLIGSHRKLGAWSISKAKKMSYFPGEEWAVEMSIPADELSNIEYKYVIKQDGGKVTWEQGSNRKLALRVRGSVFLKETAIVELRDTWRKSNDPDGVLLTSAFIDVLFSRHPVRKAPAGRKKPPGSKSVIRLQVVVPRIDPDHSVYVVGSIPSLGKWDTSKSAVMESRQYPVWTLDVNIDEKDLPFTYKYVIKDRENKKVIYELGSDRSIFSGLYLQQISSGRKGAAEPAEKRADSGRFIIVTDNKFRYSDKWRGAGIAVPVFSLRSKHSLGVGDFMDLKLLVDWVSQSGFQLIQLLPVNDTSVNMTWWDSYPYSGLSVFALHPLYLDLDAVGSHIKSIAEGIDAHKKILNAYDHVRYEEVMSVKLCIAREIFKAEKNKFLASAGFKNFFKENSYWLEPYAAFCYLRDLYGTSDFSKWEKHSRVTERDIRTLNSPRSKSYNEIAFYYFLQYHLHIQFHEAARYARHKRVVLKGDIPIGVNKHSDSCWINPELFNLDQSAGAPPDPFSEDGQNWGFPTYNWYEMAYQNYLWWKWRLNQMSGYFQMIRLDHVLGFFRIWEIPNSSLSGLMGHFNPSIPLWREELESKGIWDFNRLLKPYINDEFLGQLFGDKAREVAGKYLKKDRGGLYGMKPEFDTQRKVEAHLAISDDELDEIKQKNDALKRGLFTLISNVVLFKDPDKDGFHPRVNMMKTHSFGCLEEWLKKKLELLYVDYYYRRQEKYWRQQGMVKLPVIKDASRMLICGEDLGMIPACVPAVMREQCILGLRIQRMPPEAGREFGLPHEYGYLTVCTTSSHDMSTVRGWWEEDRAAIQRYYNTVLGHHGDAPPFCEPWICQEIIVRHLESPSMWAIFPIQDILAMSHELRYSGDPRDEQINRPDIKHHYWKYRMHISLEKLVSNKNFSKQVLSLVNNTGRNSSY
ncbi:4-alpha-glucanotransferase [Candidatus Auribacterota bacterium]